MWNYQFVFRRRQPNELNELNEFNRRLTLDLKSITIVKSSYTICRIKIRMAHDTFIIWNWNGLSKGKRSITLFDTTLAGRDFGILQHQREVLSFIPFAYSNYLYRVSNYSKIVIFYVCLRYDAKPELWPIWWHHSSVDSPRQIHDIDILSGSPFLHYIDTRAQNIGNWGKTRKNFTWTWDSKKNVSNCFTSQDLQNIRILLKNRGLSVVEGRGDCNIASNTIGKLSILALLSSSAIAFLFKYLW